MMHRLLLALIVGLAGIGFSCTGDGTDEPDIAEPTPIDCASEAETWDGFAAAFVADNCIGCHSDSNVAGARGGAPAGVDFDTEAEVLRRRDDILRFATGPSPIMPPGGGPDDASRRRFQGFLQCTP